jgi:cytochrome P450
MPSLHNVLANNPIFRIMPHGTLDFVRFAQERVDDRLAKYDSENTGRPDLLSHFIAARETYPEVVTDKQVLIYGLTNVIAGSLSTSHVLDEIVKYLATHPDAQQRIHDEVDGGIRGEDSPISFEEAKKSPYLEGVILEGFRIHSVANLSSERVVGPNGMQLPNGVVLPPGTYVGINPAALNRRSDVFGDHPHNFDPLRWLKHDNEAEDEYLQRRLQMDRATLTFGHGSRSCLGKNIVQLEVFKLIATLCSRFEVSFGHIAPRRNLTLNSLRPRERWNSSRSTQKYA